MSWNATVDRLRAQAQQYGLANDYATAKLLYEAVDEITRLARRVPDPDDLQAVLSAAEAWLNDGMGFPLGNTSALVRLRATLEGA